MKIIKKLMLTGLLAFSAVTNTDASFWSTTNDLGSSLVRFAKNSGNYLSKHKKIVLSILGIGAVLKVAKIIKNKKDKENRERLNKESTEQRERRLAEEAHRTEEARLEDERLRLEREHLAQVELLRIAAAEQCEVAEARRLEEIRLRAEAAKQQEREQLSEIEREIEKDRLSETARLKELELQQERGYEEEARLDEERLKLERERREDLEKRRLAKIENNKKLAFAKREHEKAEKRALEKIRIEKELYLGHSSFLTKEQIDKFISRGKEVLKEIYSGKYKEQVKEDFIINFDDWHEKHYLLKEIPSVKSFTNAISKIAKKAHGGTIYSLASFLNTPKDEEKPDDKAFVDKTKLRQSILEDVVSACWALFYYSVAQGDYTTRGSYSIKDRGNLLHDFFKRYARISEEVEKLGFLKFAVNSKGFAYNRKKIELILGIKIPQSSHYKTEAVTQIGIDGRFRSTQYSLPIFPTDKKHLLLGLIEKKTDNRTVTKTFVKFEEEGLGDIFSFIAHAKNFSKSVPEELKMQIRREKDLPKKIEAILERHSASTRFKKLDLLDLKEFSMTHNSELAKALNTEFTEHPDEYPSEQAGNEIVLTPEDYDAVSPEHDSNDNDAGNNIAANNVNEEEQEYEKIEAKDFQEEGEETEEDIQAILGNSKSKKHFSFRSSSSLQISDAFLEFIDEKMFAQTGSETEQRNEGIIKLILLVHIAKNAGKNVNSLSKNEKEELAEKHFLSLLEEDNLSKDSITPKQLEGLVLKIRKKKNWKITKTIPERDFDNDDEWDKFQQNLN
jgi:hypothetical protein